MCNLSSFSKITSITNNDDSRNKCDAKNLIFVYTGIFPFIALSYMNLHIFLKIRQSRQVQKTLEQVCKNGVELETKAKQRFAKISQ